MKALLIYPEWPDTYWSFKHALSFEGKRSVFPPLGLLTVASLLPKTWEKRLVDLNVRPVTDADLDWADVVMVSAMLVQKQSMMGVLSRCRARGLRTVVGGPITSCTSDLALYADHVVIGEAEEIVAGLAADRDIIEIYGRKPRAKSPAQMVLELEQLYANNWRGSVFIVDDNFIGNKRKVKEVLPVIAEWNNRMGRPFSFYTEASVNLADDIELLQMMKDASFDRVFLGIETPAEESLKEAQKMQNTHRSLLESVRRIQHYGMEVMAGFIVGFDNDPEDIFRRQVDFIRDSAIPLAMVGLLQALPGTQLHRRLQKEGRLLGDGNGNNLDFRLNFVPRMDPKRLIEGYRWILEQIYRPDIYYARVRHFLAHYEPHTRRRPLNMVDVRALVHSILRQGVFSRYAFSYWRLVLAASMRYRESFGSAIRLAIMGYHFEKLTRLNLAQAE
jgi:radical SAM superfamily enzyme YgiQ (UPF0313 family)